MSTSTYSEEVAEQICDLILDGGILSKICMQDGMPSSRTVLRWLDRHEDFRRLYDRAREIRAEVWAEEILDISDDTSDDWIDKEKPDGSTDRVVDHEHVTRSKLKVDSRKWLMSKAAPRRYGEKLDLNHSGAISTTDDLDFSYLDRDERAVLKELVLKAKALKDAAKLRAEAVDR